MYLIKIELSKINHNFEILFRTEITTFLPFSPCNRDVRDQNLIVYNYLEVSNHLEIATKITTFLAVFPMQQICT